MMNMPPEYGVMIVVYIHASSVSIDVFLLFIVLITERLSSSGLVIYNIYIYASVSVLSIL